MHDEWTAGAKHTGDLEEHDGLVADVDADIEHPRVREPAPSSNGRSVADATRYEMRSASPVRFVSSSAPATRQRQYVDADHRAAVAVGEEAARSTHAAADVEHAIAGPGVDRSATVAVITSSIVNAPGFSQSKSRS